MAKLETHYLDGIDAINTSSSNLEINFGCRSSGTGLGLMVSRL